MQQLLQTAQKLEDFVSKNDLANKTSILKQEFAVQTANQLRETIESQQAKDRVLKIGIIGRVKAGKSSFLNALIFDGNDILPKAATPMTAALTILEYSQEFGAEVDFYTQEDIINIQREHGDYLKRIKEIEDTRFNELFERQASKGVLSKDKKLNEDQERDLREKAKAYAEREMKNDKRLSSSYDQYERIKSSGLNDVDKLEQYRNIKASDMDELKEKLMDFVGSSGKFMPLTKSVTLKLNCESLKDLQIIDSPGINDPVASREQRTSELLKDCDVVFLVSPSGQFLNAEDMDLLDRVNTKEGIQEFYVVASQSDNQLFGSIREKSGGIFDRALECIQEDLTKHMHGTFTQKKLEYQQNGYERLAVMFDKLIQNPVVYTSGMAYFLMKNLENPSSWDENAKVVWENLQSDYHDFFDETSLSQTNLKKLANIDAISHVIQEVRTRKEEIQRSKQEEYISTKMRSLREYQKALVLMLSEAKKRLEEADIKKIQQEKEELSQIKDKCVCVLDTYYKENVEVFGLELDDNLLSRAEQYFSRSEEKVRDSRGTKSEEIEYTVERGMWWWKTRETRYRTKTFEIVKAGEIRRNLEVLIVNLEDLLRRECKRMIVEWKSNFKKKLIPILRRELKDVVLDISLFEQIIENITKSIVYPEISYSGKIPASLQRSGDLRDYESERFMQEAIDFVSNFQITVRQDIIGYIKTLMSKLDAINLGEETFAKYSEDIDRLETEIQNKQSSLEHYSDMLEELHSF